MLFLTLYFMHNFSSSIQGPHMDQSTQQNMSKTDYILRRMIHYSWLSTKILLIPFAIYTTYFLYQAYQGTAGFTKQEEAIRRMAEAVMEEKLAQGNISRDKQKIGMAISGVSTPYSCSFWTFDHFRHNCRRVSITVLDFNEAQRNPIIYLINHVASPLARPCENLHVMPAKEQAQIGLDLGSVDVSA